MHYIVEYEICALIFLIVLTVKFYESRQFPNKLNKIFGFIMLLGIADIFLDIVTSYIIMNAYKIPKIIIYSVNNIFYMLQIFFPVIMLIYTMEISKIHVKKKVIIALLYFPALFFIFDLWIINPIKGNLFYLDQSLNYFHGSSFPLLYIGSFFYILLTLFIVNFNKKSLAKKQRNTINAFIAIVVVSIIVQYSFPSILLTGVAISLAIMMMYFTLQNPDDMIDVVTGTFNYAALLSFLGERTKDLTRYKLVAIEISGMRQMNSLFGLEAGNEVLNGVGQFLIKLKKKAWVFRIFGTRYILITNDDEYCDELINKISARFAQPWVINATEVVLTATIRHFTSGDEFGSAENIVNLLDEVFNSEDIKKGTTAPIDKIFLTQINRNLAIEASLKKALLTKEGFWLVYQPIYCVSQNGFYSAEALLRFNDPILGSISPAEFIPIAEKKGLIIDIDEMVVKIACDFIKRAQPRKNLGINTISVNLSAAEFLTHNFPARLKALVEGMGVDPDDFVFEITETAAGAAGSILKRYMNEMNTDGYTFAMDDFGTGYSNITQIVNLPFSTVKFDRSLLVGNDDESSPLVLFETLLSVFKQLGYKTIVEGVETLEQLEKIKNIADVDYIQGFYYARPMKEDLLCEFIFSERNKVYIH